MPSANQTTAANPPLNLHRVGLLLLFLLVLIVFHPALQGELLRWDDDVNISTNPHITGLGWEQIRWSLTDTKYYWRFQPLAWLTWNTLYQISGSEPFLYHLVVVVVYAASAVLVFLLIEMLLQLSQRNRGGKVARSVTAVALLATALWAFHPMRVEAVAWAVELVYVMPLFFWLLSLLTYLRAAATDAVSGRDYWLSVLCFAASLFTFPIALGGLVVFVALDICPLNRISLDPREWFRVSTRRVWLEKIPFFALTLLATSLNLYARAYNVTRVAELPSLGTFSLFARVMQGFYIWAY
jgi:hypothetical protein